MSSLAIPAPAPATASANAGTSATPAAGDGKFGDTLRQTQAGPETQAGSHSAGDTPAAPRSDAKPDAGDKGAAKGDRDTDKQTGAKADDRPADASNPPPLIAAPVPLVPAVMRQTPAAGGNPSPVAAAATAAMAAAKSVASTLHPAPHAPDTTSASAGTQTAVPASAAAKPDPGLMAIAQSASRDAAPRDDANHGSDATSSHPVATDFGAQLGQLAAAHALQAANTAPAPMPPPLQLALQATPDQQPQFTQEAAQNVVWLATQGIQKAEIQLNPRTLGPIHVEVSTHNDRVDVSFAVAHPQTVHALQQTLPHLNDMLARQGLNLGQASVGQQSPGQQHAAPAQHLGGAASGNAPGAEADTPQAWRPLRIATPGRVDDFA